MSFYSFKNGFTENYFMCLALIRKNQQRYHYGLFKTIVIKCWFNQE